MIKNRRPILILILIMATIVVVVEGLTLYLLYNVEFNQQTARLVETAQSQARLMEAIARFDEQYSQEEEDFLEGAEAATLSQIREAHRNFRGFGDTGEFMLGKLSEVNRIEFLLNHRHDSFDNPQPIPFDSRIAEPMRRALTSKTGGTMVGLDYRGETVLAAYEPVAVLNYGIVAKIDLAEIRQPFVGAGLIAAGLSLILIGIGTLLFLRIGFPLVRRIEESEERFRTIFEEAPLGVALIDSLTGHIYEVNPQFAAIARRTREEMTTIDWMSITHPDDVQEDLDNMALLNAGKIPGFNMNKRYRRPDGSFVWINMTIAPVTVADKGFPRHLCMIEDIDERKRAEEERLQLDVYLRQHQKLESIGTLASGVAHEINNPVNGIINYAQLISDNLETGSSLHDYAKEIIHESDRVSAIVRDLLFFSRDEKESHSPANIKDILEGTLSLIQTIIKRDQIVLKVEVAEALPKIKCRSQQIQQVLMNLMTNARDALNERYPEYDENKIMVITVRLFEKKGSRWIRTTVEDHGRGIPLEIQDRPFDPFFSTKDKTKGTGLGLSISYGIVQEHYGLLYFETVPEQFTRFYLELPIDNGWTKEQPRANGVAHYEQS